MATQEFISEQFQRLIKEAQGYMTQTGISEGNFMKFRTSALNLIRRSCGDDSDHYLELRRLAQDKFSANNTNYMDHCYGILEAASRDFDAGLLFDMKSLIAAEVLGDFIEQSEALLQAGYYHPAASLLGAVLEDTLRKLCKRNKIPVAQKTKLDTLNADLARALVYDNLTQKQITAFADIRNNADHGKFEGFKKADVEDMLRWIRNFAADNLK